MMTAYREYSENAELTHIEKVPAQDLEQYRQRKGAVDWRCALRPAGEFLDWHPSNRKSLLVVLSGHFEIGVSDGTRVVLGAGDMCIFDDYGKGHTGRVVGDEPCETLHIGLSADN
jgi:quercetin dioxygenase-like cupin family protein